VVAVVTDNDAQPRIAEERSNEIANFQV